jgi:predicted metal-dependent hydrolase
MKEANPKQAFKARVRTWADKLDVKIVWLGVRPMQSKWASCSTNGHLNFNDELIEIDGDLWDYVIVHELLHFSVPNHGKLWKSLMRVYLGDWEALERRLPRISKGPPRRPRQSHRKKRVLT